MNTSEKQAAPRQDSELDITSNEDSLYDAFMSGANFGAILVIATLIALKLQRL